jgi:hypothetical protein
MKVARWLRFFGIPLKRTEGEAERAERSLVHNV